MKFPFSLKPFHQKIFFNSVPWFGHICLLIALWLVLKPIADEKLRPYEPHAWNSVIWADKSGYYIYLPASFIYHWDGTKMAADLPQKAGFGFSVDPGSSVIRNKYLVGVAYFEAPFFLYAHYVWSADKTSLTGLESQYQWAVARAGLFWGILGVGLLAMALTRLSGSFGLGWFCALSVFWGSNLFYYTVLEPGFSHPYSFMLFSGLLLAIPWKIHRFKTSHWVWAGLLLGLIFATRVLNTGFALLYLGFVVINNRERFSRRVFTPVSIGLFLGLGCLALFPQLLYWKYAFGNWFTYSYQGEGFTHYLNPDWRTTFLSVNNGLFIQTPIWFLFLLFPLAFVRKQPRAALLLWGIFGAQAYLCASWWAPGFGCSFGHRVFVDILPFAALGMALCFKTAQRAPQKLPSFGALGLAVVLVLACTYYTQRTGYRFGGCWQHDYFDYDLFYNTFIVSEKP